MAKIELLAPARDLESAIAAIDWGADAVYIGAPRFGARHAAGNPVGDISRVVDYARRYGVRVYATMNTLLFEPELREAGDMARSLISAGVDALIIQDMAYLQMGLEGVEFHASTQVFNEDAAKIRFLEKSGFSRVILERGLTLEQIRDIRSKTEVELECFVYGAICVGYSGRCFLSRSAGPRSGNRGDCSQPCRQTYDLVDSQGRILEKNRHLLSLQDLDLSAALGELIDAGVTSFKIEGRLKDMNYIKNSVGFFRRRLDEEIALRPGLERASRGKSHYGELAVDLSKTFTRGRSQYYLRGKHPGAASFDTPKALGEKVGTVAGKGNGWFEMHPEHSLDAGDGICFMADGELSGTNINRVEGKRIFPNRNEMPEAGVAVYRNYDHKFSNAISRAGVKRTLETRVAVSLGEDSVEAVFTCEGDRTATILRKGSFDRARDGGRMVELIRENMAKSGDTVFRVTEVDVRSSAKETPFLPVSLINSIRREALALLLEKCTADVPPRKTDRRDASCKYPQKTLGAEENVVNSLAEEFYRAHGVVRIDPALEISVDLAEECVMRTPYCIRRETGRCLREDAGSNEEDLWLVHGTRRYRVEFDCGRCEMKLIYERKNR